MYILPAFQQFPENGTNTVKNVSTVPWTKKELLYAIQQHRVDIFLKKWKRAHLATNFPRWLVLGGSEGEEAINEPYWVTYTSEHFEPYVVVRKDYLPLFFPEYRGFGFNKASWFVECVLRDFKFRVLPNDFVVHMNHPYGKRRNNYRALYNEHFSQYLKKVYGLAKYRRMKLPLNQGFVS